jgi:hypothetical protein
MTLIPVGFYQNSPKHDLARAIMAMRSVTVPSSATPVIPAEGTSPAVPAQTKSAGIPGWLASFDLSPNIADKTKTDFLAELPFSQKIYNASGGNQRKAIQPLSVLAAIYKAVNTPGAVTAANLEVLVYDAVAALAANPVPGQTIYTDQETDKTTGRTYIKCYGTLDGSIEQLLTDTTAASGGSGGG